MKLRNKGLALTLVVLAITLALAVYSLPPQSYLDAKRGAYVDQLWYRYIESPDAQLAALLTHEVDASGVPRPGDIKDLMDHGFTLTRMSQIGQTFTFENNRLWPFGCPDANITHPDFMPSTNFRKAIHRLIDTYDIVDRIYTDPITGVSTMSRAGRWLPSGMEAWTAMGQPYGAHTAPDIEVPPFDPCAAADLLDAGGFVQGTTPNPDYDPDFPCSATHMRIDPNTGEDLTFEYYAIGPDESPLGWAMAELISGWLKKAGVGHDAVPGTWLGMVIRLINPDLLDFQMMTGVGIVWGSTAPDILRDFTYPDDIPLWNFAMSNFSEQEDHPYCTPHYDGELNMDAKYWGDMMMGTLDIDVVKHAAFEIQEVLRDWEPYRPLLHWENYAVTAGAEDPLVPTYEGPGGIRIVNMAGQGLGNTWNRQRMWAGREYPEGNKINIMIYSSKLCSQNILEADCAVDYGTILGNVHDGWWRYTPFYRSYWYTGAEQAHESKVWIGPGSSEKTSGDGLYDVPYQHVVDPETGEQEYFYNNTYLTENAYVGSMTIYVANNSPDDSHFEIGSMVKIENDTGYYEKHEIAAKGTDVVLGDYLIITTPITSNFDAVVSTAWSEITVNTKPYGDDHLGMVTLWKLRDDLYWHDSDPGPDGQFGTGDDGVVHKVTTADVEFMARLLMGKAAMTPTGPYENVRYYGIWQHFAGYVEPTDGPFAVEIIDDRTFKIYEERRFVFSFESHDILTFAPKHIWEPYCNAGGDPNTWEGWDRTKATVNTDLLDPVRQRLGLSDMYLTDQIGYGPFVYHHGGWKVGVSTNIEVNPLYYGGNAHPGPPDVDMEVYYNPDLPEGYRFYGLVDAADYKRIIDARDHGPWPGKMPVDPMWDPTADLTWKAQEVTSAEITVWREGKDKKWGPGYP